MYFKEAKLSPAEWCWRLRFDSTMKYFVKISINNNKISHCALRCSAISPIQRYSIWLLSKIQTNALCSKSERNAQKMFFGGRGFRTHDALLARRINWSLRPLDHEGQIWIWLDFKYFNIYQKSINFWMAFKAKNGRKWTHQWAWPLLQTSIEPLYPVASLISPNHRIPGFVKFF